MNQTIPIDSRKRRCLRKLELLSIDPRCVHCGRLLKAGASRDDSAHLVIDRLSCFEHVRIVRKAAQLSKTIGGGV